MNSNRSFLQGDEIEAAATSQLGAKARELARAAKHGFVVPAFVAVANGVCENLLNQPSDLETLAGEIKKVLASKSFAVRSSAMVEDGSTHSHAGIFKTSLDVSPQRLAFEMRSVLEDARGKLGGSLAQFSLIVQEFVEPDYAGVLFTRDPRGRRELVFELAKGRGDKVVEGRTRAETFRLTWATDGSTELRHYPVLAEQLQKLKTLESESKKPLDIEWCVRGSQFYFLQVRPITSISAKQHHEMQLLDDALPKKKFFLYEKNAITEVSPRPSPLMFDLLKHLSRQDGPVAKVYRLHGIHYTATETLKRVGTELYVDREAEAQSLIPAAKIDRDTRKPALKIGSGWFRSLRNILALSVLASRARVEAAARIRERLRDQLQRPLESEFIQALADFERAYEIIFEINLLSGLSLRNAENVLKKEEVSIARLLETDASIFDAGPPFRAIEFDSKRLLGNGLDIGDESTFTKKQTLGRTSPEVSAWWTTRSPLRQKILAPTLRSLIEFTRLREEGRWLTVRHIDHLRSRAKVEASRKQFTDSNSIYGADLLELSSGAVREECCLERLKQWNAHAGTNFPNSLSSEPAELRSRHFGVSGGVARGRLVSRDQIANTPGDLILLTDSLTPDLVEQFRNLRGIVSSHGGLLSHLSILAREHGLPVLVGVEPSNEFPIGAMVEIDGDLGEIRIAKNVERWP